MRYKLARPRGSRWWLLTAVIVTLYASVAGIAQGAEWGSGDSYVLPAGRTTEDDLYVSAGDVIIDGKVQGDLIASGGLIEVNGEVTGDLIAAGGGVTLNGKVGDDVRVAGGGVTVRGSIGDDLLAAGGGAAPGGFVYPITVGSRSVQPGVFLLETATVAGDAYIVGGTGEIDGSVAGDLFAGMNEVSLTGAVGGDADLYGDTIDIANDASIRGTLTYEAPVHASENTAPAGVAAQVLPVIRTPAARQDETLANRILWWAANLARTLVGLFALGAILLVVFPGFTNGIAGELQRKPWSAAGLGFLFVLLLVPLTILLSLLAWLFWGTFPGGVAAASFLFGLWGLLWMFSPAIAGYWLGRILLRNNSSQLLQLFVGAAIILVAARAAGWIPVAGGLIGWLVLLCSFALAAGSVIMVYHRRGAGDVSARLPSPPGVGMHPTAT